MTSAYSINLNFNNTIPVKTDFTFKQGDKGITLNLATTGLDTTGTTAKIVFKRSNGTSVEADLVGAGPTYSYTILGNEFEIPGVVVADLKLYNGDTQRVSTASFIFQVTGDTMDGVGGGTGGYSDQLEQLSEEFEDTLNEYKDAFGDVGAVNPRGAYDSTEDYNVLDLVSYQGSSYLCRTACKNKVPTNTTYWQVFASGSGGVDYNDVGNKPSINSVTLSGNKTTEDLGLFSGDYNDLENQPTIPSDFDDLADVDMDGVTDGQVPTWDATAQKYKPGTPAAGGGTNPNLLINPWFTVNQRGFTTKTVSSSDSDAYCFDRWKYHANLGERHTGYITATSNGIKIGHSKTPSDSAMQELCIRQYFDGDPYKLTGKKLTLSILLSNGDILAKTITVPSNALGRFYSDEKINDTPIYLNVFYDNRDSSSNKMFSLGVETKTSEYTSGDIELEIRAVKLEIGSTSTLHLDTAPDYTTEQLKCQRYFYRIKSGSSGNAFSYVVQNSAQWGLALICIPAQMRITPTLSYAGTFEKVSAGSAANISSMSVTAMTGNYIQVSVETNGTSGTMGTLRNTNATDYLEFSAEL